MNDIALIPCRGGSKGIPLKNLQQVHGVPLVIRAIRTCHSAGIRPEDIFVSTDNSLIGQYAVASGARVLWRPSSLSTDSSSTDEVLVHSIESLLKLGYSRDDNLFLMQATSPFTTPQTLQKAMEILRTRSKVGIYTATEWHGFVWNLEGEFAIPFQHNHLRRSRRQDLNPQILETGGVYGASINSYIKSQVRFCDPLIPVMVNRLESIEIDSWDDLLFCNNVKLPRQDYLGSSVKVLFTDFDGVLTNNHVFQSENGELGAMINRSDGIAVELFRSKGIPTFIITGEKSGPAFGRAKKLQIECIYAEDKLEEITRYCAKNSLTLSEVAYVGNDLNDIGPIASCGHTFVPKDSHPNVAHLAQNHLHSNGGEGVLREIFSHFFS